MLIYFSEDRFHKYTWSRPFREFFRRLGIRFFVIFYPLTVVFFGSFAGASFQLPDLVQGPYWVAVASFFAYYVIWLTEGIVGTRLILGKQSLLDRLYEKTLKLSAEGMTVIAEALSRLWRGMASGLGHPATRPIDAKRTLRVFIIAIELIVIAIGWFIEHSSGFALSYALAGPLYVILIFSGVLGWRGRRKKSSLVNSSETIPQKNEDRGPSRNLDQRVREKIGLLSILKKRELSLPMLVLSV